MVTVELKYKNWQDQKQLAKTSNERSLPVWVFIWLFKLAFQVLEKVQSLYGQWWTSFTVAKLDTFSSEEWDTLSEIFDKFEELKLSDASIFIQ